MASKPTSKPDWVSGDQADRIQEPTGSKKDMGFKKNEKPPFNFFNWLFNILSHWLNYFAGNAQYNVIIDSDTDEGDYTSAAAYVADSPSAGDRVLIKVDEALTATLIFPAGIEITQQKGKKFTVATNFSPIILFGDNTKTKGDFRVENSDTGTIAIGIGLNGDENDHDNLIIENKSTGTITVAHYIASGKVKNHARGNSIATSGTITNDLVDDSTNDKNHVTIKGDAGISRSNGAKKFLNPSLTTPTIGDFTYAQHDHEDADDGGTLDHNIATNNPLAAHGAITAVVGTTNSQTLTNKTLTTPTIGDFNNAQHNHGSNTKGGDLAPKFKLISKTSAYTATDADSIILVDTSGGAVTITLPTAVGIQGKAYTIKKINSSGNDVTVDGNGGQTIDGTATYVLYTRYDSVEIVSDGSNWMKISENFGTSFKIGDFSRDISLASGTQVITGVGFKPKAVIFLAMVASTSKMSIGVDTLSDAQALSDNHGQTANSWAGDTAHSIYLIHSIDDQYGGTISTLDSDGFTITWTKIDSPTGTAVIIYLATR